jgi:hypothetical protein
MTKAIKLGDTDGLNLTLYNTSGETIIFGDGSGDLVQFQAQFQSGDTIANNTIVFGNGNSDTAADNIPAYGVVGVNNLTNNTITFGDGQSDSFSLQHSTWNGDGDQIYTSGSTQQSGNNTFQVGNGNGDQIILSASAGGPTAGGDHFITGTGIGDQVLAFPAHTNPDTFAFALGTGGINFTTVGRAQQFDQVVVNSSGGNGNALGNTLVQEAASPVGTTLAQFIAGLGPLVKGDTYVGNDSVGQTFIVTDTQNGGIGAIDIVGVSGLFTHSTISHHVLTLMV